MKLLHFAALLSALTPCISADQAQIFLSPAPKHLSESVTLSAPQANAVLAHRLGVSQYEHFPKSNVNGGHPKEWEKILETPSWSGTKMVVLVECGAAACKDVVPSSLEAEHSIYLPNLPLRSWLSVATLHMSRLAYSLGFDVYSNEIWGLDRFISTIKSIPGWAGWVGAELGSFVGWNQPKRMFTTPVESQRNHNILTDLDFVDGAADTLIQELESLAKMADNLLLAKTDDGPQKSQPSVFAFHFKGLAEISKKHAIESESFLRAAEMFRKTVDATVASLRAADPSAQVVFLSLPVYTPPMLRKRHAWLQPFHMTNNHFQRSAPLAKRQAEGEPRPEKVPVPVVPTSHMCFESADDVNNQTASCLGHGIAVKGVTTRGGDCWVCSCHRTVGDDGKITKWAGQGCEKQDLSSEFNLLFFSCAGLILILFASVTLLVKVGNIELPGTLASVGGVGLKRT